MNDFLRIAVGLLAIVCGLVIGWAQVLQVTMLYIGLFCAILFVLGTWRSNRTLKSRAMIVMFLLANTVYLLFVSDVMSTLVGAQHLLEGGVSAIFVNTYVVLAFSIPWILIASFMIDREQV